VLFSSHPTLVNQSAEKVFGFVSNLNLLGTLMPDQVVNWKSDKTHCSFSITGMTDLSLKVDQSVPNSLFSLVPEGKSPFGFKLKATISEKGNASEVVISLDADLNPMLAMMAKRPLQNLVQIMAEKLSKTDF
jgi:carbon monoxide dehydrogenase subunit G